MFCIVLEAFVYYSCYISLVINFIPNIKKAVQIFWSNNSNSNKKKHDSTVQTLCVRFCCLEKLTASFNFWMKLQIIHQEYRSKSAQFSCDLLNNHVERKAL